MNSEIEIKIRTYDPTKDYPQVRKCMEDGKLFYESMDSEERLARAIAMSPGCILVADLNGLVVGSAIIQDLYGPLLFRLAVSPDQRGKGVGKKLNDAAKERAKSQGFTQAHILVAEAEPELQELYKSWGWEEGSLYRWMYADL